MELLRTLLIVYSSLLAINVVFSVYSCCCNPDRLYRDQLRFWIFTFITFALEGVFQSTQLAMVLSFATSIVPTLALVTMLSRITEIPFSHRRYLGRFGALVLASMAADWLGFRFAICALPVAVGISYPLFHGAITAYLHAKTRADTFGVRIYCALMVLYGIHLLDYPFLRLDPVLSLLGFSIALGLLMANSIFIPTLVLKTVSDRYSSKMAELNAKLVENQNRMMELMSLAQVGELSFSVVHDMASPTTLLLHYARELASLHQRGHEPGQERGAASGRELLTYTKGIENATLRLVKLQKVFRAMLRKDSGESRQEVDLGESIRGCADLFLPFLEKHGIALKVRVPEPGSVVVITPGVIERILLNLMQNAVRAMTDGGKESKELELGLAHAPDHFSIWVRDTGPGIAAERLQNLWEKFGHSESAKTGPASLGAPCSGGSGFGLYKVRQMVQSLGGDIEVGASSPEGTTFRLRLPRQSLARAA